MSDAGVSALDGLSHSSHQSPASQAPTRKTLTRPDSISSHNHQDQFFVDVSELQNHGISAQDITKLRAAGSVSLTSRWPGSTLVAEERVELTWARPAIRYATVMGITQATRKNLAKIKVSLLVAGLTGGCADSRVV